MRRLAIVLATALACAPALAATAEVTYLSGSTVYVGAGEQDGVIVGVRLASEDLAAPVVLEAFETTPGRAACRVVEGDAATLAVGDRLRFEPPATLAPASTGDDVRRGWGGRGRIGVRYLVTKDDVNEAVDFRQPAVDLRIDAPALYGSPWGLRVDVRGRRTLRPGRNEDRSRVYALNGTWDAPGPGWRFGLGRQFAPDLANVSVFDGALAAYDGERFTAGGFAGVQPDAADYGFASDVREYGIFAGWRAAPGSAHRWTLTTGAVSSTEDSEINRDYLFVHGTWIAPRWSLLVTQEVDVNRGWKRDAGESSLEPTSTFASLRIHAGDWLDLLAGFDNRRNVRLYRDFVSPVTAFDDAFRRGAWLGAFARAGDHFRFGLHGRTSRGGDAGTAEAVTATAGVERLTRADLSVRLRATSWENDRLEGTLLALELWTGLGERVRLGLEGGVRDEDSLVNPLFGDRVTWYGVSLEADLGKRVFATLTLDRSDGDLEELSQLYATLAYRF